MMRKNDIPAIVVFSVSLLFLLCNFPSMSLAQKSSNGGKIIGVKVGVILNLETDFGKMGLSCINMALSDFYTSNPAFTTRLRLHTRNSKSDVVEAAASALDLIKNVKVEAILGPETSMQTHFVIELGDKAQVPIITFSAKSPSLTSLRSPYFFRVAANDSSQVEAIAAVVKAFGWREVVPIYVDNEYGEGIIPYLTDALQDVDAQVPYRSVIPPTATDDHISAELYKLMTMQTRVFVLHMLPDLAYRIFAMAEKIGMMGNGYVWIMTDGVADFLGSANSTVLHSMQGVLGLKTHVPKTNKLQNFTARWRTKFQRENPTIVNPPMVTFGLWAYDAVFGLAKAVEEIGKASNFSFKMVNVSSDNNNSTDLGSFGVSRTGPELVQALSKMRFKGLSGEFKLVNGQLQTSTFEIINVNGSGERKVGFWTLENGLERTLGSGDKTKYSALNTSLAPIIWPGDSTSAPKGWQIPANGKTLRIGVPMKDGFKEFVNVSFPFSNDTVSGYSIDVFEAVLEALPYSVSFEYVPFAYANGSSAGTYNDLVYQVFDGKLDAAVGDITIRANRSLYVDFTLPYTESGVYMIVPIKDDRSGNAWAFLKPLTWDLWVTSGCFFIFVGFVVWVLEHRINEDFRGPPYHQIGTSFWYSFSTMVFAHKERVVSNLARFVVIIWCFVVLILTQSYTASLASLLTVQQLQPTITDVNQLLKNKEKVGFHRGSFIEGILKQMGFEDHQFVIYDTPEDLYQLFANGSKNNGIAAAFDETPYMKLFMTKYCSKFTMVEPTFKADGFAFAFPKGSHLVQDISRAILEVTEGKKMKVIEKLWFKNDTNCVDPNNKFSSNSLGLESFWGLFLIAGVASSLALVIYAAMFLYEQRNLLMNSDAEPSVWRRIAAIFRTFDEKDLSSHTFRKNEVGERSVIDLSSPNTNCLPSPSGFSVHTNSSFVFREPGSSSPDPNGTQTTYQETVVVSAVEVTYPNQDSRENHYS
ncbi:glutamate receptor 2.7-like isoform X2 [Humulus lupulus]|uniref:glutamate receptor 2.7-like isoform X2 n=1 Tax=Humulus lupulus TaxID=3486 RepID=UPI002B401505|nr:glutamate receptor 2.7-like isoform X2 [Humulus lupulus]